MLINKHYPFQDSFQLIQKAFKRKSISFNVHSTVYHMGQRCLIMKQDISGDCETTYAPQYLS